MVTSNRLQQLTYMYHTKEIKQKYCSNL